MRTVSFQPSRPSAFAFSRASVTTSAGSPASRASSVTKSA